MKSLIIFVYLFFCMPPNEGGFIHLDKCEQMSHVINSGAVPDTQMIYDFIVLKPLKNNVEYLEWRSELLFDLLKLFPEETISALTKMKRCDRLLFYQELMHPIHDGIDINQLYAQLTAKRYNQCKCKRISKEILTVLKSLTSYKTC